MKRRVAKDHRAARVCVLSSGIVTSVIGLCAFAGWILGRPLLASFGENLKPMAPSSALLFFLLGMIFIFHHLLPQNRWVALAGKTIGFLSAVATLLIFVFSLKGIRFPIEHLGLSIDVTFGETPLGYMSSVTAFCFILIGASLWTAFSSSEKRTGRNRITFVFSCLVILVAFLFLLAYLYGAPLMYGGKNNPPSLPTTLALLVLGFGLLVLSGRRLRPRDGIGAPESRVSMILVPVFALLAAGIVATGYFYYRNYEKHFRTEAEHQLSAVADLKVHDLVQWRKERMGDATVFYGNENFSSRVKRLFQAPDDRENEERTRTWMRQARDAYDYDRVCLHDSRGVERLSVPDAPVRPDSVFSRSASEVLKSGEMVFQDFYRSEEDGRIYLSVLIPILDASQGNRAIGVLALRIDPEHYLYPLINRWPAPSRTAETLLIRREGGEAVFLNELRFRKDTALNLRSSIHDETMPAVKAALGQEGIVEGNDYRGVPVVADVRAVPGSPWFLVARMDKSEIYAPLRERLWILVVLIGAFLLSAGAGLGVVWRRQSLHFYQERYEAAEALRESEAFTRMIMDNLPIGLAVNSIDPAVKFEYMNDNFPRFYRTTREALAGSDMFWEAVYEDPELRETMKKRVLEDVASGNPAQMYWEDVPITRKGEETTYVTARNTPIPEKGLMISAVWDVTERKRAEEALRASEEKYRLIAENADDWIYWVAPDKTLLYISPSCERLTGYSPAEFIDNPNLLHEIVHQDDRENVENHSAVIQEEAEPHTLEYRILTKTGETRWISHTCSPVHTPEGRYAGRRGTNRNITERKRAEESLRESERKYRTLVENIPQKIFIKDKKSVYVTCNENFARDLGITPEEFVGKTDHDFFPKELADHYRTDDKRVMRLGKTEEIEEKYIQDGQEVCVQTVKTPIRDEQGHVVGLQGIFWDITERKRVEEALRESENKFRTLFANMTEGVALHELVCDEAGKAVDYRLLDVNPAYERHTDISVEQVRGRLASDLYGTGDPPYLEEYVKVARGGKPFAFETYFPPLKKHFHISVVSPKHGQFATVFEDITEQKRREEELRQKNEELERFTYTISHDLKSPLVTIKTFLGYLEKDRSDSDPGRVEQDMLYIRGAADKMGLLLDELLEMSRIGRVVNPSVKVSFHDLVDEALAAVAGRISEQKVEISVSGKKIALRGDRSRLAEIWQNLIENAVKFMGDQAAPRIELGVEKREKDTVFFVRDNGAGIDARYQEKVFGLFEKLDKKSEGTGLGLALVKRIVELYKGKIWLESEGIGKGSCFRFTLPEAVKKA